MKQQMNAGKQAAEVQVDVRLSVMKETSDKWFEGLYDHLRASCQIIIINGFKKAGIADATENQPSLLTLLQMVIPLLTLISFVVSFTAHRSCLLIV